MSWPVQRGDQVLAGRYRLGRVLGRGSIGVVWAAQDELLRREVAVKEIQPPAELTPDERRLVHYRTMREARVVARISHPFVITVYDVLDVRGRLWIIMEKLVGRSLQEVIADRPLPPPEAVRVGLCLVSALDAAHHAGVLHRDVKPANVMLADDGRVILTDFGIATIDGDPQMTGTGLVLGSPGYMAPERARGEPPTSASDMWSLGATLFAAVEGRSPIQRDGQLSTLAAVVSEDPPLAAHAGELAAVIDSLLQRAPGARPTVAQARALLEATAEGGGTPPAPSTLDSGRPHPDESPRIPLQPTQRTRPTTSRSAATSPGDQVEESPSGPQAPSTAPTLAGPDVEPDAAPPHRPHARPRWKGLGTSGAAILALIVIAASVIVIVTDQRSATPGTAGRTSMNATASGTAGTTLPSAGTTGSTSALPAPTTATSSPATRAQRVPAGFHLYEDASGFRVAIPDGWQRSRLGTRNYFKEPGGRRFLQVDQTTEPQADALTDWRRQEGYVSRRLTGYRRISIRRIDYRGWNAADWEFTWRPSSGTLHVINRNIRVNDRQAYAIYWSTPSAQWRTSQRYFDAFTSTFTPAP
jgi:serine/threonine protein kinase